MPLLFWLLDTTIINSYIIWRMYYPKACHEEFRLDLLEALIASGKGEASTIIAEATTKATATEATSEATTEATTIKATTTTCKIHILKKSMRRQCSSPKCSIRTVYQCLIC